MKNLEIATNVYPKQSLSRTTERFNPFTLVYVCRAKISRQMSINTSKQKQKGGFICVEYME
jgi:hypothetical protein